MPDNIDSIIESLFYILPLIHKRLLKVEPQEIESDGNLSRAQVGVLLVLREEKRLPISEIAQRLLIPKPQMTRLINHLFATGLVERQPNWNDRRVKLVSLTHQGMNTLDKSESALKRTLRQRLASFNRAELEELAFILARLKDLGSRLEKRATAL